MFRSLRFRLPALFLAAIVLAGVVSTAVAVSVSKRYAETTARRQAFRELRKEAAKHPVEEVGTRLRALMPWLESNRLVDRSRN